jgi:hypothetical protein
LLARPAFAGLGKAKLADGCVTVREYRRVKPLLTEFKRDTAFPLRSGVRLTFLSGKM